MKRLSIVAVVMIMSASSTGQQSQANQFKEDFAKTVEKIRLNMKPRRIGFHALEQHAGRLAAGDKDTETTEYLKTAAVTGEHTVTKKLALLVLAKLTDSESALQALTELASSSDVVRRNRAIIAASFLPADKARTFAHSLLTNSPDGEARAQAVELLGFVGDKDTLDLLKKQAKDERNTYVQVALNRAVADLEFRESITNKEEREQWDREQKLYWQAVRDMPRFRTITGSVFRAADLLAKQGVKFSPSFLRHHMRGGEGLAMVLAAKQKELVLLDDLKQHMASPGVLGDIACQAVMEMCPEDALRVFEEALAPDNLMMESNRRIARFLAQHGDEKTVEVLMKAKKNSAHYSAESRKAFMDACGELVERIEARGKGKEGAQEQWEKGGIPRRRPTPKCGVCDLPVRVPDGLYTARVELDMGPYLGKVAGEKPRRVRNP